MADQDGRSGQLPHRIRNIFQVIGNSSPAQISPPLAVTMPAQIDGISREAVVSEVAEKMHIPTPGPVHHSVYKQEGRWMLALQRVFGDDLQLQAFLLRWRCHASRVSRPPEPAVPLHGMAL